MKQTLIVTKVSGDSRGRRTLPPKAGFLRLVRVTASLDRLIL